MPIEKSPQEPNGPDIGNASRQSSNCTWIDKKPKAESSNEVWDDAKNLFPKFWRESTADNRLTLFGFRRFRTTHLLNLRFLEAEIHQVDHKLYQIGLSLDHQPVLDRLGLKHAKKDAEPSKIEDVDAALVQRLRSLIKEYDEAVCAFNRLMTLETFSLADNTVHCTSNQDLHAYEKYKTRLVRVDLPPRTTSRDPIQHYLRKGLRRLWYAFTVSRLRTADEERGRQNSFRSTLAASWEWSYQNTARVAETISRFAIALLAGGSLVGPLVILSYQEAMQTRITTVAVFIVVFCFLMSLFSKAQHSEVMAASAAYAAVLSVFVSNGQCPGGTLGS